MRRRLVQLYLGLVLYGFSASLLVLSGLGLSPWDVLHQGLAKHSNLAIGTWSIIVGLFVITWAAALAIWRFGRIEQRWERAAARQRSR